MPVPWARVLDDWTSQAVAELGEDGATSLPISQMATIETLVDNAKTALASLPLRPEARPGHDS